MNEKMFCYQCQETAGCKGCTMVGVCGKQPDVAAMQDLLVYVSKGLSAVTTALRREGQTIPAVINHLITLNLFTTITNANFDRESIEARIRATLEARQEQLARLNRRDGLPEAALWDGSGGWEEQARAEQSVCRAMQADHACYDTLDAEKYWRLLYTPPQAAPAAVRADRQEPCPWRRFLARGLDMLLCSSSVALALMLGRIAPQTPGFSLLTYVGSLLLLLGVEPVLLHLWGVTPGTLLLGLTVASKMQAE